MKIFHHFQASAENPLHLKVAFYIEVLVCLDISSSATQNHQFMLAYNFSLWGVFCCKGSFKIYYDKMVIKRNFLKFNNLCYYKYDKGEMKISGVKP